MNEKSYKILRQDESILLKRIIGVQKQASTTKTYQSLNVQELIYIWVIPIPNSGVGIPDFRDSLLGLFHQ
jgi:hypothetical protein